MTAPEYLDPVRHELEQLRARVAYLEGPHGPGTTARLMTSYAQKAEARVEALTQELATVRDTLRHRSNALNATGTHNDQLRAQLARVRALPDTWEREADEIRQSEGEERDGPSAAMVGIAHGRHKSAIDLRATLADKEPTP